MGMKIGSNAIVGGNFGSKATYYNCGGEDWKKYSYGGDLQ